MILEQHEAETIAAYFHEVGELLELFAARYHPSSKIFRRISTALEATRHNEAAATNTLLGFLQLPDEAGIRTGLN